MSDPSDYQSAARRVLAELRHLDATWRLPAWRTLTVAISPELADAIEEVTSLADRDSPMVSVITSERYTPTPYH